MLAKMTPHIYFIQLISNCAFICVVMLCSNKEIYQSGAEEKKGSPDPPVSHEEYPWSDFSTFHGFGPILLSARNANTHSSLQDSVSC